jgi:uncharacterized repeat protein (TIGR01451 family)
MMRINFLRPWMFSLTSAIALLVSIAALQTLSGATAPSLGTAASFAVLGGATVTNTGPTVLTGNLGVSPGSAITGFPPGVVVPPGTIHVADAVAAGAQSDNTTAYNSLAGQACNTSLTGQDLGGLTLVAGVYCFSSSAQLTGTLTLDAQGNPAAVFIFQIGSTLTTASNSSVNIINGGSSCNVFWQIGSSATLGTTTSFMGNILALASITLNTGATLSGSALAQNGAVTLDDNSVSVAQCNVSFVAPPNIVKAFGAASIGVGGSTGLSFTISNPNAAIPLNGVAFSDTLPAGLIVSTPSNGLTGSCGGGTITAVAGSGSVSLSGATLAGGGSCTFSVNVTGTATGAQNNSVTVASTNGGTGNTSATSITVLASPPPTAAPTIVKAFGAASIGVGGTTSLSFTINNPNASTALNGVAFSDTLPAGLIVSTPSNGLTGSCGGGTITAVAGSGSVSLSGATLAGGASCTFSVNVTGTTAGAKSNSVAVSSTNGGAGNTSTQVVNVVVAVVAPPVISKAFGVSSIAVGGTTTLSFTINNPNAAIALNGVNFTDILAAGLIVSTPNGLTGSCGGGTISAVAGSGSVSLSGATLAGGASCTFSVNVTVTTAGAKSNSVAVSSTNGGAGNTSTQLLNVMVSGVAAPVISKAFGTASIGIGGTTTLSFTINNPNPSTALNGVAFSDPLPPGLIVSTPNNGLTGSCGGGTITAVAGSGNVSLAGATLAGGASCTFSVNVTATAGGLLTNIIGGVTSTNGGLGNTTTAQLLAGEEFLVSYVANLQAGESEINFVNTGSSGASLLGPGFGVAVGNICVNVYGFSPDEQLITCCSCLVTPDGVVNLGVNRDLNGKTLTGVQQTSMTIKLVASLAGPNGSATSCTNSAASITSATLVSGVAAWSTTLHQSPTGSFSTTENPFSPAMLSAGELASLGGRCGSIIGNGSGFGICNSCRQGALGAAKQ